MATSGLLGVLSCVLMRKNVNNDVSKDPPIPTECLLFHLL